MKKDDELYWARFEMDLEAEDRVVVRKVRVETCGALRVFVRWTNGRMSFRRVTAERVLQPTHQEALEYLLQQAQQDAAWAALAVESAKQRVQLVKDALATGS